jgi:hypothetical protein
MMSDDITPLLTASQATEAFGHDVAAFMLRQPADRIHVAPNSPRVKVLRTIAQLLHSEPTLEIERVEVRAASGCADFVGRVTATDTAGTQHTFDFEWNCEWKAKQLGYVDGFGFPDQIRAAQEFGWQCFERWTRVADASVKVA